VQNCTVWCFLASLANCFLFGGGGQKDTLAGTPQYFFLLGQYPLPRD